MEKLQMVMKKPFLTMLIYVCLSFPVLSDSHSLNKCVSYLDNNLRLKCYDAISKYNPEEDNDTKISSAWEYTENIDDFTDKNTSRLLLEYKIGTTKGSGYPDHIVMRCDGMGDFEIYVSSSGHIGSNFKGEGIPIRYRFGSEEAVTEKWGESASGKAAFYPSALRYKANSFYKMLLSGKDFIFSIEDFRGIQSSAKFDNSIHPKFNFILGGCKS